MSQVLLLGEAKGKVVVVWDSLVGGDEKGEGEGPEYSIVMPIHNQEGIVVTNLEALVMNTVGRYEIILIFDGCSDLTEVHALKWLRQIAGNREQLNISRVLCFRSQTSLFETSADNLGFRNSQGRYIVEIQADQKMMTFGYNWLLSRPCRAWPDEIFAVSGRCCTLWLDFGSGYGQLGGKVEHPLKLDYDEMNRFYIGETVCRGPLLIVREKLHQLNYLDEVNFVLENDDHDLAARAYTQFQWLCGYVPIEVYAPLSLGSTRKHRDPANTRILEQRRRQGNGGFLAQWHRQIRSRAPRKLEVREIPFLAPGGGSSAVGPVVRSLLTREIQVRATPDTPTEAPPTREVVAGRDPTAPLGIHWWDFKSNIFSQNGEDGILAHLLEQLQISKGWVCEFGAGDGKANSNTFRLVSTRQFQAVYIESSVESFHHLAVLAKEDYTNIHAIHATVSPKADDPHSLNKILGKTKIPTDFDVLSIDIDGLDWSVWHHLNRYLPKVVVVEINSTISPADTEWIERGDGGNQGTGYYPMVKLGLQKGYRLVTHTGNLIFLRSDLARSLPLCSADPLTQPEYYFNPEYLPAAEKENILRKQATMLAPQQS